MQRKRAAAPFLCTPSPLYFQAHLVLETNPIFRLILGLENAAFPGATPSAIPANPSPGFGAA